MKKVIVLASMLLAFAGFSFAQTAPAKTDKKVAAKTATPATAATTAGPKKKDGTADMRYKANKDAAKPAAPVHTKKDGTADKRYKENKTAPAKKG
jgi:hypothetical protein